MTATDWFDPDSAVHRAAAPGRLDVMGGIADYSGSLVLQMPIAETASAAVEITGTGKFEAISVDPATGACREVCVPLDLLQGGYARAREHFDQLGDRGRWGAYVFGPLHVLVREKRLDPPAGVKVRLESHVPQGRGVSSSAAVEVATLRALAAAMHVALEAGELAVMGQQAENHIAGAPCGVMDQMASALGRPGELLALRCQPAEVVGHRPLPPGLAVWGVDSGLTHAVSGSDYGSVRAGAFMGYRYLARAAGLKVEPRGSPGRVRIEDARWGGYAANLTPAEFEADFRKHVPEQVRGQQFLKEMGGTTDPVTRLDPERWYAPRRCVAHPIYEHFRVRLFARLLQGPADEDTARLLGELMYQSHASYSACGLGSEGTDDLVRRVRTVGPAGGLYGAKITGGGSGGTVAVLGRHDAGPLLHRLAREYGEATGRESRLFQSAEASAAGGTP